MTSNAETTTKKSSTKRRRKNDPKAREIHCTVSLLDGETLEYDLDVSCRGKREKSGAPFWIVEEGARVTSSEAFCTSGNRRKNDSLALFRSFFLSLVLSLVLPRALGYPFLNESPPLMKLFCLRASPFYSLD